MVTGICNIYINTPIKFHLFKETFPLVYLISDNWLVYIRGKFKDEVVAYIRSEFQDSQKNCTFFEDLVDQDWAKSTFLMMGNARYENIYLFWEDHFLIKPIEEFKKVILEFSTLKIDYLQYSFFNLEIPKYSILGLYPDEREGFYELSLDKGSVPVLRSDFEKFYPFSLVSLSSKSHFLKILNGEIVKHGFVIHGFFQNLLCFLIQPLSARINLFIRRGVIRHDGFWGNFIDFSAFIAGINRLTSKLGIKFFLFPRATPFNLEKSLSNFDFFPLKLGVLKDELFANWDDDNGLSNSALIKRGAYPFDFIYKGPKPSASLEDLKRVQISKGGSHCGQYYRSTGRTDVPIKYLKIIRGKVIIKTTTDDYPLAEGEDITVYANIPHDIIAHEDSEYAYRLENLDSQRVSYFDMV